MVRLLHTADWHLGKRLGRFERLHEQEHALASLLRHADEEKVDLVLIAGDIFDTAIPTAEAQQLFFTVLSELSRGGERPVVVVAGNHDSPERLEAAAAWGQRLGILLVGFPESPLPPAGAQLGRTPISSSTPGCLVLHHPHWAHPLRLIPIPFLSAYRLRSLTELSLESWLQHFLHNALRQRSADSIPTVVLTHLYCRAIDSTILDEDEAEKPATLGGAEPLPPSIFPPQVDYVALGHLHGPLALQSEHPPIVYAGSLLQYAFDDPYPEKSIVVLELSPSRPARWERRPLQGGYPLRRIHCNGVEEALRALAALPQQTYVELTVAVEQALQAEEYQRLQHAHPRLVRLQLLSAASAEGLSSPSLPQLHQLTLLELFRRFYRYANKGTSPNRQLEALFEELVQKHREASTP